MTLLTLPHFYTVTKNIFKKIFKNVLAVTVMINCCYFPSEISNNSVAKHS